MLRIWLIAVVIVALMVIVKDHHALHRLGLTGYCTATLAPPGTGGSWRACHPGRLSGPPDLTRDSCQRMQTTGAVSYWRCPAAVAAAPG